eukprot:TRINITY_DN4512_c1_g1_i2.p1 TRINITY_DN4512_c1_g1~~TRINITY_DN4512_c1_g1_i2.p1  ORF type:complete len:438 (+),score=10.46 TRINITY_DN4512_c1_g1_i2:404-1717(+)
MYSTKSKVGRFYYYVRTLSELPRAIKIKILKWIQEKLTHTGKLRGEIDECYHARVPVITFIEGQSDIVCDLTIGNEEAAIKSRILNWMCQIDHRVPLLLCLVKSWARQANVNSPKQGTFNSFALMLMVIFHLQSLPNPILPPIQKLFPDKFRLHRRISPTILGRCAVKVRDYKAQQGTKSKNKQSVLELFKSFLARYAVVLDIWGQGGYLDFRISTWKGKWVQGNFKQKYRVLIEDFLDHSDNCARTLGKFGDESTCSLHGVDISDVCLPFKETYAALHSGIQSVSDAVSFIKNHFHDPKLVIDATNFQNNIINGVVSKNKKQMSSTTSSTARTQVMIKFDQLVEEIIQSEQQIKKESNIHFGLKGEECLIFHQDNQHKKSELRPITMTSEATKYLKNSSKKKQRWLVYQNGLQAVADNLRCVSLETTSNTVAQKSF